MAPQGASVARAHAIADADSLARHVDEILSAMFFPLASECLHTRECILDCSQHSAHDRLSLPAPGLARGPSTDVASAGQPRPPAHSNQFEFGAGRDVALDP